MGRERKTNIEDIRGLSRHIMTSGRKNVVIVVLGHKVQMRKGNNASSSHPNKKTMRFYELTTLRSHQ